MIITNHYLVVDISYSFKSRRNSLKWSILEQNSYVVLRQAKSAAQEGLLRETVPYVSGKVRRSQRGYTQPRLGGRIGGCPSRDISIPRPLINSVTRAWADPAR